MSNLTLFKAIIETLAVIAVCYGFYKEDVIANFEQKMLKRFRHFLKRLIK